MPQVLRWDDLDTHMMKHWKYIGLHTIAAAVFIFVLQFYGLSAPIESAFLWAIVFGGCAAGLAAMQASRSS